VLDNTDKLDKNNFYVAKNLKVMEWLKAEIVEQVSKLFKSLISGKESHIIDSMASLVVSIYVLSRRIGVPFHQLDHAVQEKLHNHLNEGHEVEEWYGDLSLLQEYIKRR